MCTLEENGKMSKMPFRKDIGGMCIDCGETTLRMAWGIELNICEKLFGLESERKVTTTRYLECMKCHKEIREIME